MGKLTVKQCDGAKAQGKRVMLADGDGLWLCVRPTGAKSWISRTKRAGVMREKALGSYPEVSLAEARRLHSEQSESVKTGKLDSLTTFADVFDKWIIHYARTPSTRTRRPPTDDTIKKIRRRHRLYLHPLDNIPVQQITRGNVVSLLDDMHNTREEARQCFNLLKVLFEWAQLRGIVEHNPLAGVRAGSIGLTASRPAGRVLSLDELRLVYDMANGVAGHALRGIILTGARPSEVSGMRWDEINGEWWEIPGDRMKSRKPHAVYIKSAMPLLNEMAGLDAVFVFATDKGRAIRRDSLTTYAKRLAQQIKMQHFSPHDLRRSAATHWGEKLGAAPHIVEKMLAHAPDNKLQQVYQRGQYREEMSLIWQRWALEFLDHGQQVSTVIPFAARAK